MPYANPQASFDVAVRHLFRHLDDAVALRGNPIVRRFFERPGGETVAARRAALETIRRLVREAAERIKPGDEGDARAVRQYAIFERHCLQKSSLKSVAAHLGISLAQAYRDRANACTRIARYLLDHAGDAKPIELRFDEFRFRIALAKRSREAGDYSAATARFDALAGAASSGAQRVEALCERAELDVVLGRSDRAGATLAEARRILAMEDASMTAAENAVARARIELVRWHASFDRLDRDDALVAIDDAVALLKPLHAGAGDEVKELYANVLSARGITLRAFACVRAAGDALSEALAVLRGVRAPSPLLALETVAHSYRLRNGLVTESTYYVSAHERLETLADLAAQARKSGSLMLNLNVLLGLLEFHAYAGHDALAAETARAALTLVKEHPNARDAAHVTGTIASLLTYTSHWQAVPSLLRSIPPSDAGAIAPEHLAHTKARYNLRSRAYDRAFSLASQRRSNAENPYYATKMQIVAARAAEALGRHRDAVNYVEEALSSAERFNVVPTLPDAYRVAAEITGSARLRRRAEEVSEVLRA